MTELPEKAGRPANLPEPRLSNRDFELVIRRAAELQARDAEGADADGIAEGEVLRIGRELGLSTQHLHRALAEVKGVGETESGVMTRLFGPAEIRVGRTVPGDAAGIAQVLEQYLVNREYLSVLRRFPDRVVLTRAGGATAAVGRAMSRAFNRTPPLSISTLETTVRPLEEGYAFVSLGTSLSGKRSATAAASILGGGSGAALAAAVLGIAIAPPAALLALPILGVSMYGGHAYYENAVERVQVQLESLLDRLEHGELKPPSGPLFTSRGKPY